jgi:hypothetical protein
MELASKKVELANVRKGFSELEVRYTAEIRLCGSPCVLFMQVCVHAGMHV